MADIIRLTRSPHDETQLLLPWYVNGTLDNAEVEGVEAHLAECADCRSELKAEHVLGRQVADLPLPETLAERARPRLRVLQRRVPIGWALGGPFAAAAAIGAVMYIPSQSPLNQAEYEALGAADGQPAGNLVVVFRPEQSERSLREALLQVDAQIVAGPNASGAYVLSVPQSSRSQALDRLRALPSVVLAEPIDRGS